jgi:hypothetical protein
MCRSTAFVRTTEPSRHSCTAYFYCMLSYQLGHAKAWFRLAAISFTVWGGVEGPGYPSAVPTPNCKVRKNHA